MIYIIAIPWFILSLMLAIKTDKILLSVFVCMLGTGITYGIIESIIGRINSKQNAKYEDEVTVGNEYVVDRKIMELLKNNATDEELISAGGLIICEENENSQSYKIVLTKNGGVSSKGYLHKKFSIPHIVKEEDYTYTHYTTKANPYIRAGIGDALAGPVGGVAGAMSAYEQNAQGGVLHSRKRKYYKYSLLVNGYKFDSFCVSKEALGGQKLSSKHYFKVFESSNYYHIRGLFQDSITDESIKDLKAYCELFCSLIE